MIKQIAVILCNMNYDNQKLILKGLTEQAKERNVNLHVFTTYVGLHESEQSVLNAYRVLELPDFKEFDGVIFAANTVYFPQYVNYILNQAKEANVPLVTIDAEFEGISCVKISSFDAEFEMMEHVIVHHGYKDIVFVTGTPGSNEAALRFEAYKAALEKHNIPFSEDNVYEGAFMMSTGVDAAKKMLKQNRVPQCIVSANDDMAQGILEVFAEAGYECPRDFAIVGFDNSEFSALCFPPLTTVDKNQVEVGKRSLEEVLSLGEGGEVRTIVVPCKIVERASCGCDKRTHIDVVDLRQRYYAQKMSKMVLGDIARNMMTNLAGKVNLDEIWEVVAKYMQMTEAGEFYMCLCEEDKVFYVPEKNIGKTIDITLLNDTFTNEITIPIAYEGKELTSYSAFPKGKVLPDEIRHRSGGNVYVVLPCLFQRSCYGYFVCANAGGIVENTLFYSILMDIGVALENARNGMLLEGAIDRLNKIWAFDPLTNLYNRAGFFHEVKGMLPSMIKNNEYAFVTFFDLDGLKKVNDTLGHDAGDRLILTMANCIRSSIPDTSIAMRYGGDEFVIFGRFTNPKVVEDQIERVRQAIRDVNASGVNKFVLSTSIGGFGLKASEIEDISALIEQADQKMYEEKRQKRMKKEGK